MLRSSRRRNLPTAKYAHVWAWSYKTLWKCPDSLMAQSSSQRALNDTGHNFFSVILNDGLPYLDIIIRSLTWMRNFLQGIFEPMKESKWDLGYGQWSPRYLRKSRLDHCYLTTEAMLRVIRSRAVVLPCTCSPRIRTLCLWQGFKV